MVLGSLQDAATWKRLETVEPVFGAISLYSHYRHADTAFFSASAAASGIASRQVAHMIAIRARRRRQRDEIKGDTCSKK